jgi:hypothetical protein
MSIGLVMMIGETVGELVLAMLVLAVLVAVSACEIGGTAAAAKQMLDVRAAIVGMVLVNMSDSFDGAVLCAATLRTERPGRIGRTT